MQIILQDKNERNHHERNILEFDIKDDHFRLVTNKGLILLLKEFYPRVEIVDD